MIIIFLCFPVFLSFVCLLDLYTYDNRGVFPEQIFGVLDFGGFCIDFGPIYAFVACIGYHNRNGFIGRGGLNTEIHLCPWKISSKISESE